MNYKDIVLKKVGLFLILVSFLLINTPYYSMAQSEGYSKTGLSEQQIMKGLESYFSPMKLAPLADGRERYMCSSNHQLAYLELIGDRANVDSASLIVGTPHQSTEDVFRINAEITKLFFDNIFGVNDRALAWFADKVNQSSGTEKYKEIFGDKQIELIIIKERQLVNINITKANASSNSILSNTEDGVVKIKRNERQNEKMPIINTSEDLELDLNAGTFGGLAAGGIVENNEVLFKILDGQPDKVYFSFMNYYFKRGFIVETVDSVKDNKEHVFEISVFIKPGNFPDAWMLKFRGKISPFLEPNENVATLISKFGQPSEQSDQKLIYTKPYGKLTFLFDNNSGELEKIVLSPE